MGTRADFYDRFGEDAEWLGSIAWDGYPDGVGALLTSEPIELAEWKRLVAAFIEERSDGTKPEMGWPWPWETSATTDYTYALVGDRIMASNFGDAVFDPCAEEVEPDLPRFPDMSDRKAVTFGSRSGVMVISSGGVPVEPSAIDEQEAAS